MSVNFMSVIFSQPQANSSRLLTADCERSIAEPFPCPYDHKVDNKSIAKHEERVYNSVVVRMRGCV